MGNRHDGVDEVGKLEIDEVINSGMRDWRNEERFEQQIPM